MSTPPPVSGEQLGGGDRPLGPRAKRLSGPPGGTTVERPQVQPRYLIAGGGVLVVAGVVLAVLLLRGGAATVAAAPPEATDSTAELEDPTSAALPVEDRSARPDPEVMSQAAALDQLRRELGKARLYCQISTQGDQLELRSTSCDDRQLADLLDQSRQALTGSGLRQVRCLQPHGQVVFSRDL